MMEKKDSLWLKSGCEGLTTSGDDSIPPIIGYKKEETYARKSVL